MNGIAAGSGGGGIPRRNASHAPSGLVRVAACGAAVWGATLATQYVAARLAYHPHLGPWMYRASPAVRGRFNVAISVGLAGVAIALMRRPWRWGVIPLALSVVTVIIARGAPLYSPERFFVWYAAYHGVHAYRQLFFVAWGIFALVIVATMLAVTRLAASKYGAERFERRLAEHRFPDDIVT